MPELLTLDDLPPGFTYPADFVRIVELGLVNLQPWWILEGELLQRSHLGIQSRYPNRALVVFARRQDCDDIACFDLRVDGVSVIHDFSSPGSEQVRSFENFEDWLRSAVDDLLEFGSSSRSVGARLGENGTVSSVSYPYVRAMVISALASLADREFQEKSWIGLRPERAGVEDSLDTAIHALYDDSTVMASPENALGSVLFDCEIEPLATLDRALRPLLEELQDSDVSAYLARPEWDEVVQKAARALATMARQF